MVPLVIIACVRCMLPWLLVINCQCIVVLMLYADRDQYFDESPSDNVLVMHLTFIKYLCESDIHNIYSTYIGIQ